ncbi:MAG: hypothetical protein ACREQK_10875 [Candidatus Binatia bacterium]
MNYSQSLRALGQSLERQGLRAFDVENKDDAYLIRDRSAEEAETRSDGDPNAVPSEAELIRSDAPFKLRYTHDEIVGLELEGKACRQDPTGMPDAYRLSQLLRAVGAYVHHKRGRLLALCWREQWAAVIYEAENRREVEILRPSSIYDFWVRMYVMRGEEEH